MNNANELFQKAVSRLEYVNEELNRPEEDVMTFSVCHQTRGIISDFLSAYLVSKGKDIQSVTDIATLGEMSRALDNQFTAINLESMICHPGKLENEETYCMDLARVRTCLTIANSIKGIVAQSLNVVN